MSVKDRIKYFIDSQNMTISMFEKSIGVSNGYVNSISKGIGRDKIDKILEVYSNLNLEWLLTGKGLMLKDISLNNEDLKNKEDKIDLTDILAANSKNTKDMPKYNTSPEVNSHTGFSEFEEEQYLENIDNGVKYNTSPEVDWDFSEFKKKQYLSNTNDQEIENKITERIPIYDIKSSADFLDHKKLKQLIPVEYVSIENIGKCDGGVLVVGDSMYPLIKSGDKCIYKIVHIEDIEWGNIYILNLLTSTGDNFICIKYIKKSDKGEQWVLLDNYNPRHAPQEILISKIKNIALVKVSITQHHY